MIAFDLLMLIERTVLCQTLIYLKSGTSELNKYIQKAFKDMEIYLDIQVSQPVVCLGVP